jgi:uncharacterized phiE125 gp8 family phage protein
MNVAWSRTVEPSSGNEPVTLAEAKAQVKQTQTVDDTYLGTLIIAARNIAEEYLARGLFTQTWKLTQDRWTDEIWLPRAAPLQSVNAVQYYDESGILQTVASSTYLVDTISEPARIMRAPWQVWPMLQADRSGAIEITYVVGWTALANIPQPIKLGMQCLIGRWYMDREGVSKEGLPPEVEAVWAPYRVCWRPPQCATPERGAGR